MSKEFKLYLLHLGQNPYQAEKQFHIPTISRIKVQVFSGCHTIFTQILVQVFKESHSNFKKNLPVTVKSIISEL